jgi:GNAT superfamily N-acetyltransferase
MRYELTLTDTPDPQDKEIVLQGLIAYNDAQTNIAGEYRELTIFLRDADGKVVGGLLGQTYWKWLHIDILWLDEAMRGQGYGDKMLAMAEAEGRQRGCFGIQLDTMSFQALPFYLKRGYSVFGQLDDFPPGHKKYFLKKLLHEQPAAPTPD